MKSDDDAPMCQSIRLNHLRFRYHRHLLNTKPSLKQYAKLLSTRPSVVNMTLVNKVQ